jgi:TolB-like protein
LGNRRARIVRFGNFEVDFHARELHRHAVRVKAEKKPLTVLELLLRNPGEVVSRKVLREKLWPNTTVAYEQSLNAAVNKLRVLLRDSARRPRFIETLPRRGYRFRAFAQIRQHATSSARKRILVVLPFKNFGGSATQRCFADGLTEDLTFRLAQLDPERLGIIARTSALQYKGTEKSIRSISKELRAHYIIEGGVRYERGRIRITAQLVEAKDQPHLWSATYDRVLHSILGLQRDISNQIRRALERELLL